MLGVTRFDAGGLSKYVNGDCAIVRGNENLARRDAGFKVAFFSDPDGPDAVDCAAYVFAVAHAVLERYFPFLFHVSPFLCCMVSRQLQYTPILPKSATLSDFYIWLQIDTIAHGGHTSRHGLRGPGSALGALIGT